MANNKKEKKFTKRSSLAFGLALGIGLPVGAAGIAVGIMLRLYSTNTSDECNVNINASGNGKISINDEELVTSYTKSIKRGTRLTLKAIADEGYEFAVWNDGSTESTKIITISDNTTITSYFIKI